MKCSQCSHEAEYHKDPKTGHNSKAPEHAFCPKHWEDALMFAARDSLYWDSHNDSFRTGRHKIDNLMKRVKSARHEVS